VIVGRGDRRWIAAAAIHHRALGRYAAREGLDIFGAQRVAADAHVAACDLLDDDPGHRA
jgi:hypothetical protein